MAEEKEKKEEAEKKSPDEVQAKAAQAGATEAAHSINKQEEDEVIAYRESREPSDGSGGKSGT